MDEVNVPGIVGIIFFFIVITTLGALLSYRMRWFVYVWEKINPRFRKKRLQKQLNQNSATGENVHQDTEKTDLILAGRSLGLFVGSFTLTAGWVGGGFISGTAEEIYDSGLVWTQAPWAYSASLFLGYSVEILFSFFKGGLMFSKIMRSKNYLTMLDPFQRRYGVFIGGLLLIPAFIGEVLWSLAILTALATAVSTLVNFNVNYSLIIITGIAMLYTMIGGLPLIAYTDVIQLSFISISLWISIPFFLLNPNVKNIGENFYLWSGVKGFEPVRLLNWFDSALFLVLGGIPWQTYFQKVLSVKTTKIAYNLSFTSAIFCLFLSVPAVIIGASSVTANWSQYSIIGNFTFENNEGVNVPLKEYLLPLAMVYLLPTGVMFICLGALAASSMSSTNSSLLSASTMLSHNIYKMIIRPNASENELKWVLRISILIIGGIAIGLSFVSTSVYTFWYLSPDLVYVILFPRLVTVSYIPFANSYGCLVSSIVTVILRILFGEKLLKINAVIDPLPPFDSYNVSQFPFRTFIMLIGLILDIIISYIAYYIFQVKKIDKKYDILKMLENDDYKTKNVEIEMKEISENKSGDILPSEGITCSEVDSSNKLIETNMSPSVVQTSEENLHEKYQENSDNTCGGNINIESENMELIEHESNIIE